MNCVFTIAIGIPFEKMTALSIKATGAYARRIGADFIVARELTIGKGRSAHWEKMRIYDLLVRYERVLYVDTDVIIRDTCPNLFQVVPAEKIGMLNQIPYSLPASTVWNQNIIKQVAKAIGIPLKHFSGMPVYNSGVMVISRVHRAIFDYANIDSIPQTTVTDHYVLHEQPYLDVKIITGKYPVMELDYRFNFMICFSQLTKAQYDCAFIIHYASNSPNCPLCQGQLYKDMCRVRARGECKRVAE